jgi:hypothetical protein
MPAADFWTYLVLSAISLGGEIWRAAGMDGWDSGYLHDSVPARRKRNSYCQFLSVSNLLADGMTMVWARGTSPGPPLALFVVQRQLAGRPVRLA